MMAATGKIGPCRHGVTDDICHACTVDNCWRLVAEQIPSRHLRPRHQKQAFGFRKGLGIFASQLHLERRPLRYLEVGTRLGHSLALVCLIADKHLASADAIDIWIQGYGGERNEGPDAVYSALLDLGIDIGKVSLIAGDSHEILPMMKVEGLAELGLERLGLYYDLILVDGDHTEDGARRDLEDAFELLAPGGTIVFDDCESTEEGNLRLVWHQWLEEREIFSSSAGVTPEVNAPDWAWLTRRKK
jgi:hypothetical protein